MKEDEGKRKSRRGQKPPPFRASVSPRLAPRATIYPHPHEFSRHSASSLDFRLYRPALKHPSLSLSNLERPSRCLRRTPPTTVRPLSGERRALFLSFSPPFSPESDRPRCFHRLRLSTVSRSFPSLFLPLSFPLYLPAAAS